jgi:hypothetical protein
MRKVLLSVMMVSSLLAFNACKKGDQGPAGPAGATGAPGAAGVVGARGATGADGTKILAGAVVPTTEGVVGDFYFNTANRTFYGPKTATGWGTGTSLVGATGATGANGSNGATGATGANGSNGATGATGATGANGSNGATGATGANGSNGATGATGANGSNGATGATGANGSQLLAGNGIPANTLGANGDFYFDKLTSTFYGPKAGGVWTTNVLPLGSAYAAKTFYLTRGFERVTELTKTFGEIATETIGAYNIFSSYKVTSNDLIRIQQYPGWYKNREMIFETSPGNGIWSLVPRSAAELGAAVVFRGFTPYVQPFVVGSKFRYSNNTTNPTAEFTLTADDITRLSVAGGTAFGYLTYAEADPATVKLDETLDLASTKSVTISQETSGINYNATYSALTKLDINNIPGLGAAIEKYKQEGKVFVKYRYFGNNTSGNAAVSHAGSNAGWVDLTAYANSYVKSTTYGVDNVGTAGIVFPGPFNAVAYNTAGVTNVNPFTTANFMGSGNIFGNATTPVTVGVDQVATAVTVTTGPVADRTTFSEGNFVINWNIASGTNLAGVATATPFGPTTLTNPGNNVDGVAGFTVVNDGTRVIRTFETDYYTTPYLTANRPITGGNASNIDIIKRTNGKPASYFEATRLIQVQVFVIPGSVIQSAKAKGIDVNNLDALQSSLSL